MSFNFKVMQQFPWCVWNSSQYLFNCCIFVFSRFNMCMIHASYVISHAIYPHCCSLLFCFSRVSKVACRSRELPPDWLAVYRLQAVAYFQAVSEFIGPHSVFWAVGIQAWLDFCGSYAVYVRHPDGSFLGLQPQPSSLSGVRPSHLSFSVVFVRPLLPFFRHYYDMPSAVIIVLCVTCFHTMQESLSAVSCLTAFGMIKLYPCFPRFPGYYCVYSYRQTVTRLYFLTCLNS